VAHQLKKAADRRVLSSTGLTTAQIGVMAIIKAQGKTNQRLISQKMGLNESAVTALIAKLKAMDLIKRERSQEDKRAFEIALTQQGRERLEASAEPFQEINRKISNALSDQDIELLDGILRKVSEQFEAS
jgi:DNA-binding MarR family transcriptional regulator